MIKSKKNKKNKKVRATKKVKILIVKPYYSDCYEIKRR